MMTLAAMPSSSVIFLFDGEVEHLADRLRGVAAPLKVFVPWVGFAEGSLEAHRRRAGDRAARTGLAISVVESGESASHAGGANSESASATPHGGHGGERHGLRSCHLRHGCRRPICCRQQAGSRHWHRRSAARGRRPWGAGAGALGGIE